jgi:2-C-methyl-D-erythritol 4-phosphate cytidylyltransferase
MLCAMSKKGPAGARAVTAVVLGAGRGERLGHALPKAFVPLAGRSLIERSIRALSASGVVDRIQPVLDGADFERFEALELSDVEGLAAPVAGGKQRQDSVRAGLGSLPDEVAWVVVHDAARCLVAPADIRNVVARAREEGAAILAQRVRDTIKRVVDDAIAETPSRESCWAAQTPQVMRRDWLETAIEAAFRAGRQATDDAQLLEWAGYPVVVVESGSPNPKITYPEDLLAAAAVEDASGREEAG